MTVDRSENDGAESTRTNGYLGAVARRRVLQTLGAGAGLAALSGLGSARSISAAPLRSSPGAGERLDGRYAQQASGDSIHPVYGFAAPSPEVEPPVEPDHEVQMLMGEGFFFEPTGLAIEPGDTVKFNLATPHHNVVAYHPGFGYLQRVPNGVPPFSGPLLPQGGYWLYTFEQEGVYEMNCAPHELLGMVIRIVVGSATGPAAEPLPDLCAGPPESGEGGEGGGLPLRPPELTAYTVLTDSALTPDAILDAGSVSWDDLAPESKQIFLATEGFPPCGGTGESASGSDGESASGTDGESSESSGGKAKEGGNGKAKQSD